MEFLSFWRQTRNSKCNATIRWLIFLTLILSWFKLSGQGMSSDQLVMSDQALGDFLEYWGSARLLLAGKNPYSPHQLLEVQHSVGWNGTEPIVMWNPPWTLSLLLPFGLLNFSIGEFLWLMLNTACVLVCSIHLWRIYGGPDHQYGMAWLTCFSIMPTYIVLYMTQITPLVLLGIVAFLDFHERKQHWLSGVALVLVAIKPHLVFIFWAALIAWILKNRRWHVLLGAAIAISTATIIPVIFTPTIFGYYFGLFSTDAALTPFDWATPTLSNALRLLFGIQSSWIHYLPPVLGLIWFAFYWREQRVSWNWADQMPILMLVSQVTMMFGWIWDQILLLPALIQIAVWSLRGRWHRKIKVILIAFLLINVPPLLILNSVLIRNSFWLFWMVPVFLLVYVTIRVRMIREITITQTTLR